MSFLCFVRGRDADTALAKEVPGSVLVAFLNAVKAAARTKAERAGRVDKGALGAYRPLS